MNGKDRKTLNEKDCLTDILTGEKELLGLYALCLGETEGKELSKVLKTALEKTAEDRRTLFRVAEKNGYSERKQADKSIIGLFCIIFICGQCDEMRFSPITSISALKSV